jgi:spermidine/putrescine transport system substrate-binding protein
MPGVGAWAALLLQNDKVPIYDVIPDEGAVQWTESLSIASASANKDIALKFLQFLASPEVLILTAIKPSYAASMPSKEAWKKLDEEQPVWAEKLQHQLDKRNVMDEIKEGKIEIRGIPTQQSIEEWTQAWTEFKNL